MSSQQQITSLKFITTQFHSMYRKNVKVTKRLRVSLPGSDMVYWHPKMKSEPPTYIYTQPKWLDLDVYYYTTSTSVPNVKWISPSGTYLNPGLYKMNKVDCNTMNETQRHLDGICYRATYTIRMLHYTSPYGCRILLNNKTQLSMDFAVVKNMLPELLMNDARAKKYRQSKIEKPTSHEMYDAFSRSDEEYEKMVDGIIARYEEEHKGESDSPYDDLEDDYYDDLKDNSSDFEANWSSSSEIPLTSTTATPNLNLNIPPYFSELKRTELNSFEFISMSSTTCMNHSMTLKCYVPYSPATLELWYLGQGQTTSHSSIHRPGRFCLDSECYDYTPVRLQISQSSSLYIKDSVTGQLTAKAFPTKPLLFRIEQLAVQDSGTYMCVHQYEYSTVQIHVKECDKLPNALDYRPLVILFGVIVPLIAIAILIPCAICLKSRRKRLLAVVPNPGQLSNPVTSKLSMLTRANPLYTTITSAAPLRIYRPRKSSNFARLFPYEFSADPTWEVDRSRVHMKESIGQGSFGIVYRGTVDGALPGDMPTSNPTPSDETVRISIKALRADFNEEHMVDLMHELTTLKFLHAHPHIIRLLGACTQEGTPLILLEYAVHGNLRDFLRQNRPSSMVNDFTEHQSASSDSIADGYEIDNIIGTTTTLSNKFKPDSESLIRLACHIVDGLTYMETLKLVHRDISARNVLITDGYVAKLCDFGLTRSVTACRLDTDRKYLPFHWMAPECFETNEFNAQSDIWSFGVLLWELYTLGQTPYPTLCADTLPQWLAQGNRLSCPVLASHHIYDLMLECWASVASNRPSFKHLYLAFSRLAIEGHANPPRPSNLSIDSGFSSREISRQTSQFDQSSTGGTTTRPPKPNPPTRTYSLPGYARPTESILPPTGYVLMMQCDDYLEPRTEFPDSIV